MDVLKEKNIILMICEYGFKHQSLRLNGDECDYVYSTLTSEGRHTNNPNHILVLFKEEISAEIDKKNRQC